MPQEIAISNEVLKAILSRIDEGIHVVDTNGKTIYYNEVAARHDGLNISDVIGKPLLQVFPSLNENTSTLLKVLTSKKAIYNQAQSYTNVYGKKIETMNTTLPIFVKKHFVGAMEIAKDHSTMKRLSEQLVDLQRQLLAKKNSLKRKSTASYTLQDLLTKNPQFIEMKKEAEKLARSHSPILVFGESGTGKELFVQGIHHASPRASAPFIAQNCAAIPENLLESILFGTAKGSYTGAVERPGLFELADGGTLFLDEIHAMPIELQAKLLRVLEDGRFRRLGGAKDIVVDVRVMAAMNVHPKAALEQKLLRSDLFYRLNVFTFELTSLRNRKEDILYLSEIYIKNFNQSLNKKVQRISDDVKEVLLSYSWPGNVRELKHALEYMMNICTGEQLERDDLPVMLKEFLKKGAKRISGESLSFRERVAAFEQEMILEALQRTGGNIQQAASMLRLPRQTLQYKIQKYELDAE
ncbi:sigma 54-interacting transcriptional regulator [Robertmurraya sp. DFI.2.37]|uniref:sigma-54 interaction domain-containing protein n=1 Tax=Robertmurraya sp. DFI.2.37 TaxID=3031819 RepID=UPI001247238F|nr:sigma 54-interacting transcriptional regulator [Robertmurraya sp. DFI.2.37]MDF1509871.1 sigma 54-interacting transcriptional regulator [Robertmurraya sp. DFI.2.37]